MNARRLLVLCLVFVAVFVAATPVAMRRLLRSWEDNRLLRGRALAAGVGCDLCHRPYRDVEIPNPGSRWGTAPRFEGGNAMMYVESRREIEEFIRFGAPRSWLEKPSIRERLRSQRVRMPAYGERLGDGEIADLAAWASAVEGMGRPTGEKVDAGRAVARREGCLSCHGLEGAGGRPNPRSLGGFVPGFVGRNFEDLVEGREEFEEWVRTGTAQRLQKNPVIVWFRQRQVLSMPAFGDSLSEEEIDQLWAWIGAVREAYGE